MTVATLNGHRVIRARANLPAWGCCYAEATVDGDVELAGACELKIADLTLKGTILSGGPNKGRSVFRIATGAAGWGKTIRDKSYSAASGVRLFNVLQDAAKDAGETLDMATVSSSERVGLHFARQEGTASRVLEQYASRNWYVGEDGVTRIGRRPRVALETKAPRVVPLDRARATLTLASEEIAKLVPGVVVDELEAVDVQHDVSAKEGLRTKLWGKRGTGFSRELEAMMRIVEMADPDREYRTPRQYRVVTQEGKLLNLAAIRASSGMPDLRRVPMKVGVPGCDPTVTPGTRVIVVFIDADPGQPIVTEFEGPDGEGFLPIQLAIDATALVKLGLGVRPAIGAGDLAGIFPCVPTQTKVLI